MSHFGRLNVSFFWGPQYPGFENTEIDRNWEYPNPMRPIHQAISGMRHGGGRPVEKRSAAERTISWPVCPGPVASTGAVGTFVAMHTIRLSFPASQVPLQSAPDGFRMAITYVNRADVVSKNSETTAHCSWGDPTLEWHTPLPLVVQDVVIQDEGNFADI